MEYVDLGLPSGKKWAKCNLGANSEEEAGLFFQWGDIEGYTAEQAGIEKFFNDKTHKYLEDYYPVKSLTGTLHHLIKYNEEDGKTVLDLEDDAAYVMLGEHWRIPTKEDARELMEYTNHRLSSVNGIDGFKFFNKDNPEKYIFIPFGGNCYNDYCFDHGSSFSIWLSTIEGKHINSDSFLGYIGGLITNSLPCYLGFNVRAIY